MSHSFVDPRVDPAPSGPRPSARFTSDPVELAELHRLCRDGRLYDVERWIQSGRPLQLSPERSTDQRGGSQSALAIALDRRDHSLVLLLVANGYDLTAERACPLDTALRLRRRDLLDLFLDWGVDPRQASLDALLDTYDSELYERFRGLGVDLTSGHALAYALGYHSSNKPLFGFARRHRLQEPTIQAELNIALAHHASEGNEKGVLLCLWAGADAHARVPDLGYLHAADDDDEGSSAVYQACSGGHAAILERLRPDPALDDYDELFGSAPNERVVEVLARKALPTDPSRVVAFNLMRAAWPFRDHRPVETLRALFEAGVRWTVGPNDLVVDARRELLRTEEWTFVGLMKLLATDDYCSAEVLTELARTPSMRERMKKVGLIPASWSERSGFDRSRPTRGREVLARFGVTPPKPKAKAKAKAKAKRLESYLPRTVRIGTWSRDGCHLQLDRSALFERVWTVPVEKLAADWGLSGRGLAKACRRLRVPVPPRGYWARVAAGQRIARPKLPTLPPGQAEEILIHTPLRDPG